LSYQLDVEWVSDNDDVGDKFRNPFDFMIEEESKPMVVGPVPPAKPDVVIFRPYEVSPVKTGGPAFPVSIPRQESVQGTPL